MKTKNIFGSLQRVGQSLMIPVSVLPAAGLLVALGRLLNDFGHKGVIGQVLFSGGLAIFEQLPLVFAVGVAIGFTGGAGVAGLAAAVGYFTLANILKVLGEAQNLQMAINTGVFGGILMGLVAAALYNKFHQIRLNPIFGFFAGKRFVPIITAGAAFFVALLLGFMWPPIQTGISEFGKMIIDSQFGPAFYAAGKRLLIPVGLHHVYYPAFLFQFGEFVNQAGQVIHGESARYFAGDPSAGRFMASEFPIMLFGLPAACLAMYRAVEPTKRKLIGGVMLSAALTSIITGITEPIEFAFIFVAPLLFVLHVLFAFLSGWLVAFFDIHQGYTFSASLIDFGLGFFNQKNALLLFGIVGPLIGFIYYSSFSYLIRKFDFATPGREKEDLSQNNNHSTELISDFRIERARKILSALGGVENIKNLDACITRLRLILVKPERVSKEQLKSLGSSGVMINGNNVQAVFGVESDLIKDDLNRIMKESSSQSSFVAPMTGKMIKLSEVPDATFSEKTMGEGFAIIPQNGILKSPCFGEVVHIAPTKHALILKDRKGLEVLIHVGIDTVHLKGEGFKTYVQVGDRVVPEQPLIEFDPQIVEQKAKSIVTPVVFTNMDRIHRLDFIEGKVNAGETIGTVQIKGDSIGT